MGAFSAINGVEKINQVTENHLGSSQYGTLLEVGYDVLQYGNNHSEKHLIFFGRGEIYDTQYRTKEIEDDPEYERYEYTLGLVYEPLQRIEFKADYQFLQSRGEKQVDQLNLGMALHF